jgi:hypothetical protein
MIFSRAGSARLDFLKRSEDLYKYEGILGHIQAGRDLLKSCRRGLKDARDHRNSKPCRFPIPNPVMLTIVIRQRWRQRHSLLLSHPGVLHATDKTIAEEQVP